MDNKIIQGLEDLTYNDITDIVDEMIQSILNDNNIILDWYDFWFNGSRVRYTANNDSDLDVVLFYKGDISEDTLFNIFHEIEYRFYPGNFSDCNITYNSFDMNKGIIIDIKPIKVISEKTIERYKNKSMKYDIEVFSKTLYKHNKIQK